MSRRRFVGRPRSARGGRSAVIFPLLGQSNMVGFDDVNTQVPATDDPLANMYQLSRGDNYSEYDGLAGSDGDLIPAYQPLQMASTAKGPSMGFFFAYEHAQANPSTDVYLLPCAHGSTGFSSGEWDPPSGANYVDTTSRMTTLVNALNTAGYTNVSIPAILWHQGEADDTNKNYISDFSALMAQLRSDWNSITANIPIVAGTVRRRRFGGINARLWGAQSSVSNMVTVDMMDLTAISGADAHFSNASQRTAGARMWARYNELLGGSPSTAWDQTVPTPPTTPSRTYLFDDFTEEYGNADLIQTGSPYAADGVVGLEGGDYLQTDWQPDTDITVIVSFRTSDNSVNGDEQTLYDDGNFRLYINTSGRIVWVTKGTDVYTGTTAFDDGDWHIAGGTYNRSSGFARVVVDGTSEASGTGDNERDPVHDAYIGFRVTQLNYFQGLIGTVHLIDGYYAFGDLRDATTKA